MNPPYEAIIIGGGPAGLTAGIYLMRARINTILFETQLLGGAPMNTEHIENYPGFPEGISGRDLMAKMADQASKLGLTIKEFSRVEEITHDGGRFNVRVDKEVYQCAGLIAAVGTEPVKLNIPGEDTFLGRGISYCATCDGIFFRDQEVAVVGGGDAALSEALTLANIAGKVSIVHRRDRLRAQQILQERAIKNDRIELLFNKVVREIRGGDQVESIILDDTVTGNTSELPVAGVFMYVGSRPSTGFLGDLAETDNAGFVITDENLYTKTRGLLVAGDVRKKALRQITTAVGDGALAAVNLERFILEQR
jgi:thioredoxin reductase (NADPH)